MKDCIRMKMPVREAKTRNFVPPMGYVTELAKLCGCTRQTVRNALRKNSPGEVAERVRRMFRVKYLTEMEYESA